MGFLCEKAGGEKLSFHRRSPYHLRSRLRDEDDETATLVDYTVVYGLDDANENVLLGMDYILFAQTLAVLKSLSLAITPDNPCPTGEVNRVVQGVTLYPYTRK